jgi:hypothetical protein
MRRKPYSERGISRVKCFRCGNPSKYQWQICSDGNQYRGLCRSCDIELNKVVLCFMKFPDWREKLERYRQQCKA